MVLQTEYEFTLPRGYVDKDGNLHKNGIMRLATASDEIMPMKDPRVQRNSAYLPVIVLSQVVTKLGELKEVNPGIIEKLFVPDLTYLQELYSRINGDGNIMLTIKCPLCGETFDKEITTPGE
jgi:hypothetical protein